MVSVTTPLEKQPSPRTAPRLNQDAWLDAAFAAAVEHGFDGVRVLTLADTLGVTRGSFYWHFKDHAALISALLERWLARETESTQRVEKTVTDDPVKDLELLLDAALAHGGEDLSNMRFELALRGLGRRDAQVAALVAARPETRLRARLRAVAAPDAAEGLAGSLRSGIAALDPATDGAFVFLGDMPGVPHDLAGDLAAALSGEVEIAAPIHAGRRGHPVLFARACFPALMVLTGDRGAQGLMAARAVALVETDGPGVLFDVDRREDLAD